MDYRKYGETYYIRIDKGEDIIRTIMNICRDEKISSCTFSGVGGCGRAEIMTFIPEDGKFEGEITEGSLELVSLIGNIISDESGELYYHAHASFAYIENGEHRYAAGHLKDATVRYTAELELHTVIGGNIGREYNAETGTGFWSFE